MSDLVLKVKDWKQFQHYKERRPLWIKLYRSLLDDYAFHCLPDASRALAPMIWIISSEYHEGTIDSSIQELAFRLHRTQEELVTALKPLICEKFVECLQDASGLLAVSYQDACLEKRREETEKRREKEPASKFELPSWIPCEVWKDYEDMRKRIRKAMTDKARNLAVNELDRLRGSGQDPEAVLNQSILNSWQGLFPIKQNGDANGKQKQIDDKFRRIAERPDVLA